jgi:hypothetical protein
VSDARLYVIVEVETLKQELAELKKSGGSFVGIWRHVSIMVIMFRHMCDRAAILKCTFYYTSFSGSQNWEA